MYKFNVKKWIKNTIKVFKENKVGCGSYLECFIKNAIVNDGKEVKLQNDMKCIGNVEGWDLTLFVPDDCDEIEENLI